MKKQAYIAPATEVQKIELQRMIANSGPTAVHSNEEDGIRDEGSILSRRGGFWDNEEDED